MPWTQELKTSVQRRFIARNQNTSDEELGLITRDPNLWNTVGVTGDEAPDGHTTFRSAVRLSTGGPLMHYEGRDSDGNVLCYWLKNGELRFECLPEESLVYIEQTEEVDT